MAKENDRADTSLDESGDDNIVVTLGPVIQPRLLQENSEDLHKLIDFGLDEKVASKLNEIFKTGKLACSDLDQRALEALKEFPVDGALEVLEQFVESNLEHVSNKSAFLCGVMKTLRQKSRVGIKMQGAISVRKPDDEKIKSILERTGYALDVTTGQRKYGGPPPEWDGPPPGTGCEVFCGKLPKDIYEDELIPLFEKFGKIWDLRLMMDPMTGLNRGFAFITYTNQESAKKAVKELDDFEIKPAKPLRVNISVPNLRLFVGNIPKSKGKEELLEEFKKITEGLTNVIIYSSPDDEKKNRGFCFLEYDSHKSASLAKRRLSTLKTRMWGLDIFVDWADPQEDPDEETMSKVKVLYVRNLTIRCTEQNLKNVFEAHGAVDRVKKIKDYAFVHFEDRLNAIKAMENLHGTELCGSKIEISLAKPPFDKKKKEIMLRAREKRTMMILAQKACCDKPSAHNVFPNQHMQPHPNITGARVIGNDFQRGENYYDKFGYGDLRNGYYETFYEDNYDEYAYDYLRPSPIPVIRPLRMKPFNDFSRSRVAW